MDYNLMLDFHKLMGADLTVAAKTVPWEEASRFGIMSVDQTCASRALPKAEAAGEQSRPPWAFLHFHRAGAGSAALLADHADPES